MPTDIASVLARKAEAEVRAAKAELAELTVILLWLILGCVLTALISKYGFDTQVAAMLITGG